MNSSLIAKTLALMLVILPTFSYAGSLQNAVPHSPILIQEDSGFTKTNGVSSGSGTTADPYLIERWEINAEDFKFGIYIGNTKKHFVIQHCKITNAEVAGIRLQKVENGKIKNCVLSEHNSGIELKNSKATEIIFNSVKSNSYGITLEQSTYIQVIKNNIEGNDYGISLNSSTANKITGNVIKSNKQLGVYVYSSMFNNFHHNNFTKNQIAHAWDTSKNNWSTKNEGNYWDDYTGKDSDGDDIGDEPYKIPGSGNNYDYQPLMKPWQELE